MIYTTRDEAIQAEIITPLGEHADDHDIDAIAEKVIITTGHGTNEFGYTTEVEAEEFWAIVEAHAL